MPIETLYDKLKISKIETDVAKAIEECNQLRIPLNQRRYFSQLANKYSLANAVINQMNNYQTGEIKSEELTTNAEIAKLFGAKDYNSATLYLKKCLLTLDPKIYETRMQLCLEEGGRRGGRSCNISPLKHHLWPKKKK